MRKAIVDALSGRQIIAGDEERDATQPLIFFLTQRLGWDPSRIITRPQWRVPKTPSGSRSDGYPVDIAVFDSPEWRGDPDHVQIIVECKAPDEDSGIGELKTYLGLEPHARLGIWFNGNAHALVYKTSDGFLVDRNAPIPRPTDPLTPTEAQPPIRFGDLVPPPRLGEIFRKLRDQIAAQDSKVNRDEFILNDLANLLICKIADEQDGELDPERPQAFQMAGTRSATAAAIRHYFKDIKARLPQVFTDESDQLHIDDASLETVVRTLQRCKLLGHDRQAVGQAFQILRGRALKGQEGAYFTPPALVNAVISLLDPDHRSKTIDPACGTGGFLAAALDHVFDNIDAKRLPQDRKTEAKRKWASDSLIAVDKDVVSTKLCKAYLTLLGDGRSHVYRGNSIDRSEWGSRGDDLQRVVKDETFDLVMTNPPFGKKLTVPARVGMQEGLSTCRKWTMRDGRWEPTQAPVKQQLGIAFLERALGLLKPGGRLAIVLPETFIFSKSFAWFVDWLGRTTTITHVIDVPMVAFEEFCRAKTCLIFLTKQPPSPGHRIIMSYPRSIGQDKKGDLLYRLNEVGEREGELDNEMENAVEEILAATYTDKGAARKKSRRPESRLRFTVGQVEAAARGILVPRFWWREDARRALEAWTTDHPSKIVTLGELQERKIIAAFGGHGSPPGNARRTGSTPYVKVTDLKNWRINENPTNFIHEKVAERLRKRGPKLRYGDLVTPARASSNIGQFSLVLPWQTHVVLTREVLVLRVLANEEGIDPFLLLALMSLRVVQEQYQTLALMQTNREHLGDHWREVQIPLPTSAEKRKRIAGWVRQYFDGMIQAYQSYTDLTSFIAEGDFGTRP